MALIFCQSCISILSEYYEYKDETVMRRPTVWRVAVANDSVWRRSLDSEQLQRAVRSDWKHYRDAQTVSLCDCMAVSPYHHGNSSSSSSWCMQLMTTRVWTDIYDCVITTQHCRSVAARPHRYALHKMRPIVADVAWFNCLCVSLWVATVSRTKTAGCPRNHVLGAGQDPPGKGHFFVRAEILVTLLNS